MDMLSINLPSPAFENEQKGVILKEFSRNGGRENQFAS